MLRDDAIDHTKLWHFKPTVKVGDAVKGGTILGLVQETNMITEAVNNILGLNPMGIYLKASGEYDNSVLWNGTLLPICPNMIGGILLFPAVLEEKADHIYEQGKNLLTAVLRNGSCFFHGRRILA